MSRESFINSITRREIEETTIASMIAAVSAETGISRFQIVSTNRTFAVCRARQEVMRRAYETGRFSLTQIGNVFRRDHTTVLHGIRKATERLAQ